MKSVFGKRFHHRVETLIGRVVERVVKRQVAGVDSEELDGLGIAIIGRTIKIRGEQLFKRYYGGMTSLPDAGLKALISRMLGR